MNLNEQLIFHVMLSHQRWEEWHSVISADLFPSKDYKTIWEALCEYHNQSGATDLTLDSFKSILPRELAGNLPDVQSPVLEDSVANLVVRNFIREGTVRTIGELALDWANARPDKRAGAFDGVRKAATRLVELDERGSSKRVRPISLSEYVEEGSTLLAGSNQPSCPLGTIPTFDQCMYGPGPVLGNLGEILGPTGVGKTTLACNIAVEAMKRGHNVLHYSLEMQASSVFKWYSEILNVTTLDRAGYGELFISDSTSIDTSPSAFIRNVPRDLETTRSKIVILDHVGLLDYEGDGALRSHAIGDLAKRFRRLAQEHQFLAIVITQLNRYGIESGSFSHAHTGGSIELPQIADFVIALNANPAQEVTKVVEARLTKNRLGPTGARTILMRGAGGIKVYEQYHGPRDAGDRNHAPHASSERNHGSTE